MFVTVPQHLDPVAEALAPEGMQFWHSFCLSLQHPWLLATFQLGRSDEAIRQTWGISAIDDLVARVEYVPDERIVDLLCLLPGWRSPGDRWSARKVTSIWRASPPEGKQTAYVLSDVDGLEFLAGMEDEVPAGFTRRSLVTAIGPV